MSEGCSTRRKLQHAKSLHQLRVVLLQLHIRRSQELNFYSHRSLVVSEIHRRHELEVLLPPLISPGVEEKLQQLGVPPVSQLRGIERQIDIDASNMFPLCGPKEKVRHPAAYYDDSVAERSKDLCDIDEHAAGSLNLAVGVVAFVTRFRAH